MIASCVQRCDGFPADLHFAPVRTPATQPRPYILPYCKRHTASPQVTTAFCHPVDSLANLSRSSDAHLCRLRTMGSELAWFKGGDGSHDWDYPFDLCGSVYRKDLIVGILEEIERTSGIDGLSHPNKLEVQGNLALARLLKAPDAQQHPMRGCLQRRAMVVVTINRVQSVCSNRIYCSSPARASRQQGSGVSNAATQDACEVEALDRLLHEGAELDEDSYLARGVHYASVHVGGLCLRNSRVQGRADEDYFRRGQYSPSLLQPAPGGCVTTASLPPPWSPDLPCVSVVMPVRNGGKFLAPALRSLQRQTLGAHFEVILVNDASTDASSEIMRRVCQDDSRFREVRMSHNVGVAAALEVGVRMARAPLIARMDADDLSCDDRLRRQLDFLRSYPSAAAVGSAVAVIDEEYGLEGEDTPAAQAAHTHG